MFNRMLRMFRRPATKPPTLRDKHVEEMLRETPNENNLAQRLARLVADLRKLYSFVEKYGGHPNTTAQEDAVRRARKAAVVITNRISEIEKDAKAQAAHKDANTGKYKEVNTLCDKYLD